MGVGITPLTPLSLPAGREMGDRGVAITVSDTGIGIPEDRLDKIFDRFYQVDDSQKRSHEGTGIGLALTKELVELQHGQISVQSTVGKGSIFTIMLPLGKEHLSREEIIHDDAPAEAPGTIVEEVTPYPPASFADKPLKSKAKLPLILIVEDNADMRAYMRSYLVESYEVTDAVNGVEGWEEAIRQIPDLIISDVMMPEMDGLELCTRLKRDERTSHIPVILLTARVESADKVEGLETGADDYLLKPFVAGELLVRIKNLIIQREKLRAYYQQTFRFEMGKAGFTSADQVFISKINAIIDLHLSEAEYSIERFTREVGFSHSQLTRKLEGLTGLTPSLFIRARRLWHAKILLDQKSGTVSQIAYDCGFNNLSYFSRSFRLQFGQLPSEYLRKIH